MVSLISYGSVGGGEKYNKNIMLIDGLSSETKPIQEFDGRLIPNGSEYREIDTGVKYRYDEENAVWYEQSSGGGGGGGSDNYNDLSNKPQIESVTLSGNKSLSALGIASATDLAAKADADDVYTKTETDTALSNKVDVVSGKGLSTNDFTTAYKTLVDADAAALVDVVDSGAKNLSPNTATNGTVANVAFTVNTDGTVKANGTANAATWFMIAENLTLPAGKYVISGGEAVSGNVNVRVVFSPEQLAASIIADSNGNSYTFTLANATTANVYIRMSTGRTASNVIVKPMICSKAAWDVSNKYVPYAPTNRELYKLILSMA